MTTAQGVSPTNITKRMGKMTTAQGVSPTAITKRMG